jgi:hypothetical protein
MVSSHAMCIEDLVRSAAMRGIVVAPKPEPGAVAEGWMSRIAALERLLAGDGRATALPRVYVNPHYQDDRAPEPRVRMGPDGVVEVCLDARWSSQFALLRELACAAPWVYVHTVHLARFLVPFLDRARVFVDVHGIAPEEESLYGNAANAAFFEEVEREVWRRATGVVTVTGAMHDHLARKHGPRAGLAFVLPVFEGGDVGAASTPRANAEAPTVLYAGGAQRWQCVDEMIDLAATVGDRARWVFLSHEPHEFTSRLAARGIADLAEVRSVGKAELGPHYLRADYGLVIRDPIAVNRVSCPTKLIEYLKYGVVPVVKFAELGDFADLGYRAVTVEDFAAGRLPDAATLDAMRTTNFQVLERLAGRFSESEHRLREALLADPVRTPGPPSLHELSSTELASGATSFALVSEVAPGGTTRHARVNAATWQRERVFPLSGLPLRELRLRPVQGAFVARASAASFRTADGGEVPARIEYRGAHCTTERCVCTPEAAGDIVLVPLGPAPASLHEARVSVDLVAEGLEAPAAAASPAGGQALAGSRAVDGARRNWMELVKRYGRRARARWGA